MKPVAVPIHRRKGFMINVCTKMKNQKEVAPNTESIYNNSLDVHNRVSLDFLNYLQTRNVTLNNNKIKYKGKRLGVFDISKVNECNLHVVAQYDEYLETWFQENQRSINHSLNSKVAIQVVVAV